MVESVDRPGSILATRFKNAPLSPFSLDAAIPRNAWGYDTNLAPSLGNCAPCSTRSHETIRRSRGPSLRDYSSAVTLERNRHAVTLERNCPKLGHARAKLPPRCHSRAGLATFGASDSTAERRSSLVFYSGQNGQSGKSGWSGQSGRSGRGGRVDRSGRSGQSCLSGRSG